MGSFKLVANCQFFRRLCILFGMTLHTQWAVSKTPIGFLYHQVASTEKPIFCSFGVAVNRHIPCSNDFIRAAHYLSVCFVCPFLIRLFAFRPSLSAMQLFLPHTHTLCLFPFPYHNIACVFFFVRFEAHTESERGLWYTLNRLKFMCTLLICGCI